ncbi:MAG: hypothetical protein PHS14_07620 [Elusimicrobia bacterium]|nr:hypothetical protein [Elusimicrobiota bacterium]
MTIEFKKAAEACGHAAPVFGCRGCIDRDREAAISAFALATRPPVCPDHGPMMLGEADRVAMTIAYECSEDECGAQELVEVK